MFFSHKNTKMFTTSGLRSGLLRYFSLKTKSSVRHRFLNICIIFCPAHLCTSAKRSEYKPGSTPEALSLMAPLFTWWVKSDSCYNVPRLGNKRCMKQTLWSSADHALAQMRPHQIWTRTFSKNCRNCNHFSCSLEPCAHKKFATFKQVLRKIKFYVSF